MSPPDRLKAVMLRLLIQVNYLGPIIGKPLNKGGRRIVSVLNLRLKVNARTFEYRLESKRVLSVLLVIRAQFVGEEDGHSLAPVRSQILVPECIFNINNPFSNCELVERLDQAFSSVDLGVEDELVLEEDGCAVKLPVLLNVVRF